MGKTRKKSDSAHFKATAIPPRVLPARVESTTRLPIDGERQEGNMAKGNNAQKKETKKPKKGAVKSGADSKPKDTKKK
jgi:hypothetical protein